MELDNIEDSFEQMQELSDNSSAIAECIEQVEGDYRIDKVLSEVKERIDREFAVIEYQMTDLQFD